GFYVLVGLARMEGINLSSGAVVGGSDVSQDAEAGAVHAEYKVNWIWNDESTAFDNARSQNKLVMIDFWADWCAACRELDHKSFSTPEVYETVNRDFIPLKIDGSKITDEVKATWERYGVKGLPTVLFMTPDGEELTRFEAFRSAEQVMEVLGKLTKTK
ncbi:MAG TPA: DUF255 domain-containing protein, partial [Bacteroidetes bacterium]|nr:DUF255 domain-containing protein [Bacteroidota bacterium]